ncbi:MAG: PD40 domain-containing protein [Bacteroidales bacterium]|nr:PD40 domain-containing protein [Bacteroidales bacterium]
MKSKKLIFLLLFLYFVTIHLFSGAFTYYPGGDDDEKKIYKKAQRQYDIGNYETSVEYYKQLVKLKPAKFIYNYELALIIFHELNQKSQSVPYFEAAQKILTKDSIPDLYFFLGQAYQSDGKYDNAINSFLYYQNIDSNFVKVSVTRYINACNYGKKIQSEPDENINVINIGNTINSEYSEYTSVFIPSSSDMLFTSRRHTNIYDELIEAIYVAEYDDDNYNSPEKIDSIEKYSNLVLDINEFESIVNISPDEKSIIIYFDPYLYVSENIDGIWQKPEKLGENINFNFSNRHASITADGNQIFFSGYERKQENNVNIFYSTKQDDGKWGQAVKISDKINTNKNEDSPEISNDGKTLYFSSNGHKGMGGYDIFKSEFVDGEWTEPKNMTYPINSAGDDIYFKYYEKDNVAFLSSNRSGGYGKMDIYKVIFK